MPTVAILQSHPLSVLKKEISKTNIKGYSKMKKDELIALMMLEENRPKFHHILMAEKKERKSKEVKPKRAKKSAAVADTDDELTLTKQDGSVIKMKKKKPRTVGFAFKK